MSRHETTYGPNGTVRFLFSVFMFVASITGGFVWSESALAATPSTLVQQSNTPPVFTPATGITLKQGERKTNIVIGKLADTTTALDKVVVTLTRVVSAPAGVPESIVGLPVSLANGDVIATIEATCLTAIGTYVYELVPSDGPLLGNATQLSVVVTRSLDISLPANTAVNLTTTINPQFRRGSSTSGPLGLKGVDACNNVGFRFTRDDSTYNKKLNIKDDTAFFGVAVVGGQYVVVFQPFIPNQITSRPDAVDVLPQNIKTNLNLIGNNGQVISGTPTVPVTARVTNDIRLFDNATLLNRGGTLSIIYQFWDSDLNVDNYTLTYCLFDAGGNQIGPNIVKETNRLRNEIRKSLSEKRFNVGQSVQVIQSLVSSSFKDVASVRIFLSDGTATPSVLTRQRTALTLDEQSIQDNLVREDIPTIELPPLNLDQKNQ
ncbi:MAG: hypothetical protein K1Y36_05245 [Blastocatellia bacterium]|nr:hypothetical protein [Blastocatellia bacterium]